jgi:voltage-gated potassium channel
VSLLRARRRVWRLLAPGGDDVAARVVDALILGLIVLNVAAVVAGSVESVRARWGAALDAFEVVSVVVFTVEYLGRLWAAPEDPRYRSAVAGRLRWAVTPLALIDLAAVLPFFLPLLGVDLRVARAIRLLRLVRLAKAARYVRALSLLGAVLRGKREELGLTAVVVGLLVLVSATLMYHVEHGVQPEAFSSIPATLWWAVVTLTTVGYGDVVPVTAAGRVLGACVAILGIGLFALPTAILGSGFMEELERRRSGSSCPHCGGPL